MTLMKRKVELCLAFRDMWQTSCGSFPDISSLVEMASSIVSMGCFSRVETNGGAFEQVCLMNGVDPNHAVREFVKPLKAAGIKAQMLERGLNALSLSPVSADVRELMFKVKKAQGVDVVRSFCGLNDVVNLSRSVRFAMAAGMVSQVALPIVSSPVHTIGFYMSVVESVVSCGCNEICIKDMSGQASVSFMAELIRKNTGVKYCRTITSNHSFDLQENLYRFNPTVYHHSEMDKMFELGEQFLALKADRPQIFYIWGHAYEFDIHDTWDRFEEFLKMMSGKSDITYATNKEALLNSFNKGSILR